jgi:transcriptional regulator with PAS, ATPase and Fis domain
MRLELSRLIPLCAAHELRRDLAEPMAEAELCGSTVETRTAWEALPETFLDLLWSPEPPAEARDFLSRLHAMAPTAEGALLVARSALEEVVREVPCEDPLGRNLRQLLAGKVLTVFDHLVLAFDDERRPCVGFVGEHQTLLPLFDRLRRLADQTVPVLLTGETGTGKEVAARALHRLGRRRGKPWLAVNCAELPESILESELFGHVRGSFTGAASDRAGLFEAASDGTVFLDEVGELRPAAQAKLLRVLEEHRVRRLGHCQARPLSCRFVTATNRDLPREIQRGRFRADLFYRLRGAEISLGPLRERPRDVLPLAEMFAARGALRFRRHILGLSEEARLALLSHGWPGNVRELRQVVEAAVLAADTGWIRLQDLSLTPRETAPPSAAPLLTVRAAERAHILRALASTSGNKVAAARLLGLTRQSLQRRMVRHSISLPTESGQMGPEAVTGKGSSRIPPIRRPKEIQ